MDFTVNSEPIHTAEACTITQLLQDHLNQSSKGIAIAINQTVIPKSEWNSTAISPGDAIILIKATQGG
ncbi:sulfur carrier protein ThiS [Belliella sp. DSM 111904]|uniref:Sulfur carrier protein ThiS n=1 Tax=Belliella filtrata TaxID=2923435 RepID=A0ABS9V468_9BACT|nr:sulfur carrier protein ThiS [Belliella filtrata]MCH7411207.1 sulfur carrier protein ThiS [Belliella filtrata]